MDNIPSGRIVCLAAGCQSSSYVTIQGARYRLCGIHANIDYISKNNFTLCALVYCTANRAIGKIFCESHWAGRLSMHVPCNFEETKVKVEPKSISLVTKRKRLITL